MPSEAAMILNIFIWIKQTNFIESKRIKINNCLYLSWDSLQLFNLFKYLADLYKISFIKNSRSRYIFIDISKFFSVEFKTNPNIQSSFASFFFLSSLISLFYPRIWDPFIKIFLHVINIRFWFLPIIFNLSLNHKYLTELYNNISNRYETQHRS